MKRNSQGFRPVRCASVSYRGRLGARYEYGPDRALVKRMGRVVEGARYEYDPRGACAERMRRGSLSRDSALALGSSVGAARLCPAAGLEKFEYGPLMPPSASGCATC